MVVDVLKSITIEIYVESNVIKTFYRYNSRK